ncbi:MAG: osmotically inducible protein OsmC [Deltaproteobacteria bacterium]|nr:osmotically inducible protein OsmC [Deltaproteobacteria bacterium]
MPKVSIGPVGNGQLMGIARQHAWVIDRLPEKGGEGLGPIPTELLLLSLGSCLSFNLLHYAQKSSMKFTRLQVELEDEASAAPDRISKITARVRISGDLSEEEITRLLRSAKGCKIHNTLSAMPQIDVSIQKE